MNKQLTQYATTTKNLNSEKFAAIADETKELKKRLGWYYNGMQEAGQLDAAGLT